VQQLLCEAAFGAACRLEVVFVLGKILGHRRQLAANLVPGIQHDLQFRVGRFDGCIFLRRVHVSSSRPGHGQEMRMPAGR
jgi:hypothetical protein